MRLLIVDDYRPFGQSLKSLLSPAHEVTVAGNAEEALGILRSQQLDAAVIDLGLPDMSGVDLCERILNDGISLPRGVVLTTGGGADPVLTHRLRGLRVPLIHKPFTAEQLVSVLSPR